MKRKAKKRSFSPEKSALEKARSALKKAEHASTPLSIKRKLNKPRKAK
jgi:hypothetical protein